MTVRRALAAVALVTVPFAVAVLVATLSSRPQGEGDARAAGLGGAQLPEALQGRRAPRIRLVDARGGTVDTARLIGRPYAVTFLFTRCPDVCPVIGQDLAAALRQLGPKAPGTTVIAVSVDPAGDSADAVRRWIRRQDLPPQFRYGVGTERELTPVWRSYFSQPQVRGRPETGTHTAAVWLVDRQGRWRARYPGGAPIDVGRLADDLRVLIDEPS